MISGRRKGKAGGKVLLCRDEEWDSHDAAAEHKSPREV